MTDDWRSYPFHLVPGDELLTFPAAEGEHPDQESDTWFIAGQLDAADTGRSFAFLTIFNKNRPGGSVVADFYTMALFDLDTGEYGTYTDYDMPPASMQPGAEPKLAAATGYLDLVYRSDAGPVSWTTCRDETGKLLPYTYRVSLVGTDQVGQSMQLDLSVTATRAPTPLGASTYNGKIACFGQDDTYSYFQTGMVMVGTLCWGDRSEQVRGTAGHVDRQWFPKYAGGGTGEPPRTRSHEWRTINFDNGVDMSIWRQFHRADGNALQPFTGITTSHPDSARPPECAEDFQVTIDSYVRWPDSIRPLIRPPASARYLPDRHRITCAALGLDIVGEPLVAAPAHGLPIEYMEGPYRYRGTLAGQSVSAFAFNERSLALYRDWELVDVLATELPDAADELRPLVSTGRRTEARDLLMKLRPGQQGSVATIIDDLVTALSES
ncbi:secreted hydrolase [Mycobacterium intermedium]|uniref:Secreted hydrolase n=1 Tax=Mycobacterium intermedium TaxID=28445 RepID=A0A1E3SLT5_MYCIE|nr:lipocalin-like domain-containing protein [Mycobacterium intermedium]MCV6964759.1 secreted hydrolase [Mycobacterium intermedium]ODR03072.1 secreted hydrolase [Mycobacterium intermedium]OPE49090.1 secreted hydrolase [Mycobacterium intermedium]ORB06807.1 secreted hydrolase [Mycobacterium intermedium]